MSFFFLFFFEKITIIFFSFESLFYQSVLYIHFITSSVFLSHENELNCLHSLPHTFSLGMSSASRYESLVGNDGKHLRYTLTDNNGLLSRSQREFYEKNGFLVIPNLIPPNLIDECRDRFMNIINGEVDSGQILKMKDVSLKDRTGLPNERIYNKIQDFCWDPILSKYILYPKVLDYVECFLGPNIRACHTMLINKPPDVGTKSSRHPLHQDLHYFPFRPEDRIVAAW